MSTQVFSSSIDLIHRLHNPLGDAAQEGRLGTFILTSPFVSRLQRLIPLLQLASFPVHLAEMTRQ